MKSYIYYFEPGGEFKYMSKVKDIHGNETGGGFKWPDDLIALNKMKDALLNIKNTISNYVNVKKNLPKLNEGSSTNSGVKAIDAIQLRYNN